MSNVSLYWPDKNPDAIQDYMVDWTAELATSETIVTATWIFPDDIVKEVSPPEAIVAGNKCLVWISGGTHGRIYRIELHVETNQERTFCAFIELACTRPDVSSSGALVSAPPGFAYVDAAAMVSRSEAAAGRAEVAQLAAEAAVSSTLGPMTAGSVAGTLDGDGNCLTYTCTLPAIPVNGSEVDFVPHEPSAGAARLRPTVSGVLQALVQIKDAEGVTLGKRALLKGRNYRLHHDGTFWRTDFVVSPRVEKDTVHTGIYAKPGDATSYGRVRFRRFENGEFLMDKGDGTALTGWDAVMGLFEGAFHIYESVIYAGPNVLGEAARVHTDAYPVLPQKAAKWLQGAGPRTNSRTALQRLVMPSGVGYYQLTGNDTADKRVIIVPQNADGTWLDFVNVPKGSEALILCLGTAKVRLYTGQGEWNGDGVSPAVFSGYEWLDQGGAKLLESSGGAWVRVIRESTKFLALPQRGTLAVASAPSVVMPAFDVGTADGPQSWGADLSENRAAGMAPRSLALGLGSKFYSVPSTAVGASSLLYFAAKSDLYYWNDLTNLPGQRLIDLVATIKADRVAREAMMGLSATVGGTNAPAIQAIFWTEGLNTMEYFGPSNTHPNNCAQAYTRSMVKAFQYVEAQLGHSVTWMVHTLTTQDEGPFDPAQTGIWHSVRMAQLRAPAAGAAAGPAVKIRIAPEIYGEPRSGGEPGKRPDRHYDYLSCLAIGDRDMQALANALTEGTGSPQSNFVGHFITGVATADAGVGKLWDITIDYGASAGSELQATRIQELLRMLPAGTGNIDVDDYAVPLPIGSTSWVTGTVANTIKLRVQLKTAYTGGTPRPSVVWGHGEASNNLECLSRTLDPVTAMRFYLRQYLSGG